MVDSQAGKYGGEGGIRTHGRVSPTHAFQACSLNRSDTSPLANKPNQTSINLRAEENWHDLEFVIRDSIGPVEPRVHNAAALL